MSHLFGEIERRTIAQTIVEQVKDLVRQGKLKPGQRLPSERDLCTQLGVGRSSVREATSAMLALGILEIRPGEGAYIRPDFPRSMLGHVDWSALMQHQQAGDVFEARAAIEMTTARLAARRATPSEMALLAELVAKMAAAADVEDFVSHDIQFHLTLAQISRNPILYDILIGIQTLMREAMLLVLQSETMRHLALEQHRRLCLAVEGGRDAEAEAVMRVHLDKDITFFSQRPTPFDQAGDSA